MTSMPWRRARGEHLPAGLDRRLQAGHVIAKRFAKAAGLEEIALHVDDHQRGAVEIDGKRRRLGLKSDPYHLALASPTTGRVRLMCKIGASTTNADFPFIFRNNRGARRTQSAEIRCC